MKIAAFLSIALALCLCGSAGADVTYQSDFGFRITLPDGWTIISSKDVKEKPDIIKAALATAEKNNTIKNLPQTVYNALKEKLQGGEMEYYYRTEAPVFNISVYRDVGTIAQPIEGKTVCGGLSEELGKLSDKPVTLFECRLEQAENRVALYLVADAYRDNQKYIQYAVQKSPNEILLFTGSADRDEDFNKVRMEFDKIMKSLRIL